MSFFTIVPVLIDMLFDEEHTLDAMFLQACIFGNITLLEQVYTIHTIMSSDISTKILQLGFLNACKGGNFKIVEFLIRESGSKIVGLNKIPGTIEDTQHNKTISLCEVITSEYTITITFHNLNIMLIELSNYLFLDSESRNQKT
jgi:hypothetical protein